MISKYREFCVYIECACTPDLQISVMIWFVSLGLTICYNSCFCLLFQQLYLIDIIWCPSFLFDAFRTLTILLIQFSLGFCFDFIRFETACKLCDTFLLICLSFICLEMFCRNAQTLSTAFMVWHTRLCQHHIKMYIHSLHLEILSFSSYFHCLIAVVVAIFFKEKLWGCDNRKK